LPAAARGLPVASPVQELNEPFSCCLSGSKRNLLGLATRKVYPDRLSPAGPVGSYPTFSPLSRQRRDGYFLWHWLSPQKSGSSGCPECGALRCPDFPSALRQTTGRLAVKDLKRAKLRPLYQKVVTEGKFPWPQSRISGDIRSGKAGPGRFHPGFHESYPAKSPFLPRE